MSPPSCKPSWEMIKKKNERRIKDAHCVVRNSVQQRLRSDRVACRTGQSCHLFPIQKSRTCHEEAWDGFVEVRDAEVDGEIEGRRCHAESVVSCFEKREEKKRNAGRFGGRRGLKVVLG